MRVPAIRPLEALSRLRQSDEPIHVDAFAHATRIINVLQSANAPLPFVFPTDLGGVQFEWHGDKRELDIELFPDSSAKLAYVAFENGDPIRESEADATESNVLDLLNWIR